MPANPTAPSIRTTGCAPSSPTPQTFSSPFCLKSTRRVTGNPRAACRAQRVWAPAASKHHSGGGGKMKNGDRPITIITGGSRGIGAATAVELAKAGHDLTLAYRKDDSAARETAAQAQAAGERCVLAKADITCQDDVERLFSITASQLGMETGVVNNARVTLHSGRRAEHPLPVRR